MTTKFDAVVIGSGIGGLTTAAILARLQKKRILVLESHYEIGGLTHEFHRGPYSWDVGVHYVGKSVTNSIGQKVFNYITDGRIKWRAIEDPFDRFVFPDFTIDLTNQRSAFKQELIQRFPAEKKAIKRYFRDLKKGHYWFIKQWMTTFLPPWLAHLMKLQNRLSTPLGTMTTGAYLNKYIKDPKLKAALCARWGDYGLPPGESAFGIHAVVEEHYLDGGFFPEGGSEKISAQIEEVIEHFGGAILTNKKATAILVENGRARGVRYRDVNDPAGETHEVLAPQVFSSTGAFSTYRKLLPRNLNLPIQKRLADFTKGYSVVVLFLGLKKHPRTIGVSGANHWIYDSYDFNNLIEEYQGHYKALIKNLFISFPSQKSGKPGGHTGEVITFVPYGAFEKWRDQPWKQRNADYAELKETITQALLQVVENHLPGFGDLIAFKELATPLTIEHFTGREGGSLYGVPATPERFAIKTLQAATPIQNLYLCGADAASLGLMGSLLGGVAAASKSMGPNGFFKLIKATSRAMRTGKQITEQPPTVLPHAGNKRTVTLLNKEFLNDHIVRLHFEIPKELLLQAGQHIKLEVGKTEWRAYSIETIWPGEATILVDTKFGGLGATYVKKMQKGASVTLRLPQTDYVLDRTETNICLFATSVGISPMVAILQQLAKTGTKKEVRLFFGAPTEEAIFIEPIVAPFVKSVGLKVTYCVDKAGSRTDTTVGTVKDAFVNEGLDASQYDHYLCGNPFMVQHTQKFLHQQGATRVFW